MEEERKYPFQGHATFNEDVYRDSVNAIRQNHMPIIVIWSILSVCMVLLLPILHIRTARIGFMFLALSTGCAYLYYRLWPLTKKAYAVFAKSFNGIVPTVYTGFDEYGIHMRHAQSGKELTVSYSSLRRILETEDTLVLILEKNQFLPVRKYSIRGGTPRELCTYLSSHAGLRKSAPSRGKAGTVVTVAYTLVIAFGLCVSLAKEYSDPARNANPIEGYRQAAEELKSLGITGVTPELLEEIEAIYAEFTDYGYTPDYRLDLLCYLGMGEYSDETWEWTPPDSGVFWFDSEAINVGTMYTDLLRGIRSLDPEALNFSEIEEDLSQVNIELGKGRREISFLWEGERHSFTAKENYDWVDTDVIDDIARLVAKSSTGKRLYFAWDGGQGFLVFYADPQWANAFRQATGIVLKESIRQLNPIF